MQTRQDRFLDFFNKDDVQFLIPVYQRIYSWTARQCNELFDDIIRAGESGNHHFIGTALFIESQARDAGIKGLDVIDGQQRLATLTLLLAALEDKLFKEGQSVLGVDAHAIREMYLVAGSGADKLAKLQLSHGDKDALDAILFKTEPSGKASLRVLRNYRLFCERMSADGFDAEVLVKGLRQLVLIDAMLGPNDNPQLVFESLNSKGIPLTTADLVRNYLLIALDHDEQTHLYNEYWAPMEQMFGNDPGSLKLNTGISMWLSIRFCKKPIKDKSETYNVFKHYMEEHYTGTAEQLLDELRSFSLMWAENFKFNEAKTFRSMDWAKNKPKNLVPQWGQFSGF